MRREWGEEFLEDTELLRWVRALDIIDRAQNDQSNLNRRARTWNCITEWKILRLVETIHRVKNLNKTAHPARFIR